MIPDDHITVKYMPSSERNKPSTKYAGPGNSFPIRPGHPEDVRHAWDLAGHADDPAGVRKKVKAIAKELGMADALPGTAKSIGIGDTLVAFGGGIKSLGNGRYRGPLIVFGSEKQTDLQGDFFTAETDYGLDDEDSPWKSFVLYDHDLENDYDTSSFKGNPFKGKRIGKGSVEKDDVAVWLDFTLNLRKHYEIKVADQLLGTLDTLIAAKKLGLSSGTAAHLADYEDVGDARWIKRWPLGLDASLTPTPADPRTGIVALKSLAAGRATKDYDGWRDSYAAQAAINALNETLLSCISGCFVNYDDSPRNERMARIRAEFADFTEDSIAVIDALLDDDPEASTTKSFLLHLSGSVSDRVTSPTSVVAALKGYSDLISRLAGTRTSAGRKLGEAKRSDVRALLDGASPILESLKSLLASHSAPEKSQAAVESGANKLRLLALKHRRPKAAGG